MKRSFFIIGDIEMGKGDLMDDFHDDVVLVRFIEQIARGEAGEVTLLLNGDTFDFLKMDYLGKYPRYITEDISLWKLDKVLEAHAKVFDALSAFLKTPHTKLGFIIGNHDPDLVWPAVQQKLRLAFGQENNIQKIFFTHAFDHAHFNVQHGNLIDPFFGFNHKKPIIEYKGKKILNLPLGAHMVMQYLIPFKVKFHKEEVMYPRDEAIKKHPEYKKALNKMVLRYGFKMFIADPIIHIMDRMYSVPFFRIIKHVLRHGFDGIHDDRFLDIQELNDNFGNKSLYVLSHSHIKKDVSRRGKRYIFVDCWRTERDVRTLDLREKIKTYVEIAVEGERLLGAEMKDFIL